MTIEKIRLVNSFLILKNKISDKVVTNRIIIKIKTSSIPDNFINQPEVASKINPKINLKTSIH